MIPLSDGMRARRFPIVNVALIVANFAVWIFYELPHLNSSIFHASFYPCTVNNTCDGPEPWGVSWITSMFMHGSWDHILGNMLFLVIFGKNVEDAFGHLKYLLFYFAGGFAATMLQTAITLWFGTRAEAHVPNLGASGAIAAVLGAFMVLYPNARIKALALIFLVEIPAYIYLGFWFLYQLVEANFGLFSPRRTAAASPSSHTSAASLSGTPSRCGYCAPTGSSLRASMSAMLGRAGPRAPSGSGQAPPVGLPPAIVKIERNGVEYRVGAIPLGRYVRIPGCTGQREATFRRSCRPP